MAEHPLLAPLLGGDRRALAKAITLIESTQSADRAQADALLTAVQPRSGGALRLGISGAPGAGKSTFIEALGLLAIAHGRRVAVLTIDPSSSLSGGSILGDKTRMERLSVQDAAFIRPSPAGAILGGVAEKSREVMLLCEAAGHDLVLVETVGVGQSEIAAASMTDLFLLLLLPNAGDDLQAMKRGVMEIADLLVVNKADLDPEAARRAGRQLGTTSAGGGAHVVSALTGEGMEALWLDIQSRAAAQQDSGQRDRRRLDQSIAWMWDTIRAGLMSGFHAESRVTEQLPAILRRVESGELAPTAAARLLLNLFRESSAP
jgi:LAO/AO transport system kinase